ncbi:DUF1566 domain-containing protein [Polaromonas jejuensis]|uniref:DUF1566 domain-containing protein n=1 Tax=Polaromonas jejuensis TaxID=457502 RepID=A0ABW0QAY6_9BURK|nr:DUF1566 domain-containing protein [Polaromonas jejuensis]
MTNGCFKNSGSLTVFLLALLTTAHVSGWSQTQTCNPNAALTAPDSRYSAVNGGAEVKDNVTMLIWQRCSMGQRWNGKTCLGSAATYTWVKAQALASAAETGINPSDAALASASAAATSSSASSTVASAQAWRLPTHKELFNLTEQACRNPAINTVWFPGTRANFYWSASTFSDDSNFAWGVDFSDGRGSYDVKDGAYSVRLVRPE